MKAAYNAIETHPDFTRIYPTPSIYSNTIGSVTQLSTSSSSNSIVNTTINNSSPPTLVIDSGSVINGLASYNVDTLNLNVTPGHHSNIDLHL